jgi:cyclopropane fatty-acyl-phospholipid synthase-like methyltransferase
MAKVFSPSVERNKKPILDVLKEYIRDGGRLLEIGSGTGEHALYLGNYFKQLHWITSDVKQNHPHIKENLKGAKLANVHGPELLRVGKDDFPKGGFNYVFSANTLHIMSWKEDKSFFKLLGKRLREGALVFFYGPFNYDGKFTSPSNEKFNQWLKDNDDKSGVRNFEDVLQNMNKAGFKILKDHEMPANNRMLVFERLEFTK